MITRVMPKAAQARNDVWSRMFWRLWVVRNTSDLKVITAPRTTTTKMAKPASTTRGMATRMVFQPGRAVAAVMSLPPRFGGGRGWRRGPGSLGSPGHPQR